MKIVKSIKNIIANKKAISKMQDDNCNSLQYYNYLTHSEKFMKECRTLQLVGTFPEKYGYKKIIL